MFERKLLRSIHLVSTAWFVVCVGYILVLTLHQAGFRWWVIFYVSGHSALILLLLVSLYLFAIFRGASGAQKIEIEHRLTSSNHYMLFYVSAPFLGGLAGYCGTVGVGTTAQLLIGVAMGTLVTTFLVWVIVDPVTGLVETLLVPASRRHRAERLAQARVERDRRKKERQRFLAEVLAKAESDRRLWQQVLEPQAERLAAILTADTIDFEKAEREAVQIGAQAWQLGGVSCMRQLCDMASALCAQKSKDETIVEQISIWWDGIGTWRSPSPA
jgi:hypothetical protein